MEIVEITSGNIGDYLPLSKSDVSENVGRLCYKGLMALCDDKAVGAIFWKYLNKAATGISEEIVFFDADKEEYAAALLKVHDIKTKDDGVVFACFEMDDIPDNVLEPLKDAGFTITVRESRDIIYTVGDLENIKLPDSDISADVVDLKDISDGGYWYGTSLSLYNHITGLMNDLDTIDRSFFDEDISCCIRTGKWITGMFLIHRLPCQSLIPCLLSFHGDEHTKNLICMIRHAVMNVAGKYPKDTKFIIRRHSEATVKITNRLFPGKKGRNINFGGRRF